MNHIEYSQKLAERVAMQEKKNIEYNQKLAAMQTMPTEPVAHPLQISGEHHASPEPDAAAAIN